MVDSKERLAILITGGGTTMDHMLGALNDRPELSDRIEVAAIIASKSGIGGIDKALARGIPEKDIVIVNPRDHRTPDGKKVNPDSFGNRLAEEFRSRGVTVFTQNGWIPETPRVVVDNWRGYNQHPGDPKDFGLLYGKQVHAAVLGFSDRFPDRDMQTYATAHIVTPEIDGGGVVIFDFLSVPKQTNADARLTGPEAEARFRQRVDALQQGLLPIEHRVQEELLEQIALGHIFTTEVPSYVFPGEEHVLFDVKEQAVKFYPHG